MARTAARTGGSRRRTPTASVMKPGVRSSAPATRMRMPSTSSRPGTCPALTLTCTRRHTPMPSRFTSQAPPMLIRISTPSVSSTPSTCETWMITYSSANGITMKMNANSASTIRAYWRYSLNRMATTEVRRSDTDDDAGKTAPVRTVPPTWRERIVPKTVIGMTMIILAGAVGAAFSGVVLYSYYEYRLNKTESKVAQFINGFQDTRQQAIDAINAKRDAAKAEVDKELEPIKKIQAEGQTLDALVKKAGPSLFFVHTLDEAGQPAVGSAFAVASDPNQTFLVTSFMTVRAATRRPGPDVLVRQGNQGTQVTVWTWQEGRDLALIILPKGGVPKLDFAGKD